MAIKAHNLAVTIARFVRKLHVKEAANLYSETERTGTDGKAQTDQARGWEDECGEDVDSS